MEMRILKFNGKYKELKHKGFTFQKLFANNYMQWHRDIGVGTVHVWKKGNDVEINDYYALSGAVAEFVRDNSTKAIFGHGLRFVIELKNNKVVYFEEYKHQVIHYYMRDIERKLSKAERLALVPGVTFKNFHSNFRVVEIGLGLSNYIKAMWNQDIIRIELEERR